MGSRLWFCFRKIIAGYGRTNLYADNVNYIKKDNYFIAEDGYYVENFGLKENLMIACSLKGGIHDFDHQAIHSISLLLN